MKKILLLSICFLYILASNAQSYDSLNLNENFNSDCVLSGNFPDAWSYYNTISATYYLGSWVCTPTNGEEGTPGMECTGDYSGSYHIDTALLITPELDITHVTGDVYLQFDTKVTYLGTGGLSALAASDTSAFDTPAHMHPLTIAPIFDSADQNGWVTHQINITGYKGSPFYIAFMYTSPNTYGTIWYIDNVLTTPWALKVSSVDNEKFPLTVVGSPTSSAIKVSFSTSGGDYDLLVYDMLGQQVRKEVVNTRPGSSVYTIDDLNLYPGMYFIKMGNGVNYGYTKAIVE